MSMSKSVFDPKELRPVRDFCADGTLALHPKSAERLCREGSLPAVKVGVAWRTTDAAIRAYIWKRSNAMFRKLTA
jgi:hypothetical protein